MPAKVEWMELLKVYEPIYPIFWAMVDVLECWFDDD
jgi:hypothetical protein